MSELQNQPGVLTGTESANIQELQGKVIQLEEDRLFHTSLIQDHGTRITQIETVTAANDDSIQKLDAIISKIETDKAEDQTSYNNLNNTLENLTIYIAANKEEIQMYHTRLIVLESTLNIDQDNIQTLNDTILRIKSDTSLNIANSQLMMELFNSSISTLETNLTTQRISIHDHSLRLAQIETELVPAMTSGDLNSSLLELEAKLTSLSVAISNNSLNINQIHAGVEKTQISLDNLNSRLNDTILRIKSETSLNIANSQLMMELLNSSIRTLETNLTTQSITIHDHSLRLAQIGTEMEQATNFRDLNISLLELETNLTSLGVAVSNNSLNMNLIHADIERTHNALVNLTIATNSIEVDIQSDSATIEENQRRISRVELDNNATDSLYQTMEYRLTYLEGTHTFIYHQ